MSDTILAGIVAGIIAFFTALAKNWYDSYKIKRDADLAEKKIMADAEIAAEKIKDEAILTSRRLDSEKSDKANEWLAKIIDGQEARMELERKRFTDTVQRLENKVANYDERLTKCEERHDECEKSNQFLKNKCDLLERKYTNLERRSGDNKDRLDDLEKKVVNGGHPPDVSSK